MYCDEIASVERIEQIRRFKKPTFHVCELGCRKHAFLVRPLKEHNRNLLYLSIL